LFKSRFFLAFDHDLRILRDMGIMRSPSAAAAAQNLKNGSVSCTNF